MPTRKQIGTRKYHTQHDLVQFIRTMIDNGAEELDFELLIEGWEPTINNIKITDEIKRIFRLITLATTKSITAFKSRNRIWIQKNSFLDAYYEARKLEEQNKQDILITQLHYTDEEIANLVPEHALTIEYYNILLRDKAESNTNLFKYKFYVSYLD